MCLVTLVLNRHPEFPFVLLQNRDEYYARAFEGMQARTDRPGWIAGRDLRAGGTWAAFAEDGRFALVTNYRDPKLHRDDARSRGELPERFLASGREATDFLAALGPEVERYNPFNLIVGRIGAAIAFLHSRDRRIVRLASGVHGLSNAGLDTPWPKLVRAKERVAAELVATTTRPNLVARLFPILEDPSRPPDAQLPSTGIPLEQERLVSTAFIRSESYGTVSSMVALCDRKGSFTLEERLWSAGGVPAGHNSLACVMPAP